VRLTVNDQFVAGEVATSLGKEIDVAVACSWSEVDAGGPGRTLREWNQDREAAVAAQDRAGRRRWSLAVCPGTPHDVHLVAIAHGPPVTAPYWAIPYPYQPNQTGFVSLVCLERQTLVWLDVDGDGQVHLGERSMRSRR